MDKNIDLLNANCEYSIQAPKHGKYKTGRLVLEFKENEDFALRRLNFYIDGKHFYVPMILVRRINMATSWIFQEKRLTSKLSNKQLDVLATLAEDVASLPKIPVTVVDLLKAVRPQAEIYEKIVNADFKTETKQELLDKLKEGDFFVKRVNRSRSTVIKLHEKKEMAK